MKVTFIEKEPPRPPFKPGDVVCRKHSRARRFVVVFNPNRGKQSLVSLCEGECLYAGQQPEDPPAPASHFRVYHDWSPENYTLIGRLTIEE